MVDRLRAIALDELKTVRTLVQSGIQSGTYLYPFRVCEESLLQQQVST